MPAEIQWHVGTIRFGPQFRHHGDVWGGKVSLIADLYDTRLCHLFVVAGKVAMQDRKDVLALCSELGFNRMRETRNGRVVETDLTTRPFKRRAI